MIDRLKAVTEHRHVQHVRRHWLTVAFLLGFIVDNLTLNRVDQLFDNVLLSAYVVLSMVGIVLLYAGIAEKFSEMWSLRVRVYAPLIIQYAFGGLLSGMLIFYGRSGSWAESWPFLLIILGVIYGNETIRDRSTRLVYNLSILFVGLFAYTVLEIPVLTGHMGALVFLGSGLLALIIMRVFLGLLYRIIPHFMAIHMRAVIFSIGSIYAAFNFLYFTNIIPPIPLSLKDVGIYHSVVRFENGNYQLTYEKGHWWEFAKQSDTVFHPSIDGNVFCFAKVFAPTRLSTTIFHRWEYYDESSKKWVTHARVSYPISGGSDGGYRGYTLTEHATDGAWRCTVETERGQVLGREGFVVDSSRGPGELRTKVD